MQRIVRSAMVGLALAVGTTGVSIGFSAWADPPGGFEKEKGHERNAGPRGNEHSSKDSHFQDRDRVVVRDYFSEVARKGQCPPGLAKKQNGCMPPGQAKRWRVGERLPQEVVYYELPPSLVVQLTPPPAGYRYVRVASDILMIAEGSGMVAAALEDLSR